jgi:hypothetical protein
MHPFTSLLFQILDPILPTLIAGVPPADAIKALEHIKQACGAAGIDELSATFTATDAALTPTPQP